MRWLLSKLHLKSEVELLQEPDEASMVVGLAVYLKTGGQRDFLNVLEHSSEYAPSYVESEALVVKQHIRECLASVNQRRTHLEAWNNDVATVQSLTVDDLTRIVKGLAPESDTAVVRGARGEIWMADVKAHDMRRTSAEPITLLARPLMAGNSSARFLLNKPKSVGLRVRNATVTGTWGPLFHPDWSRALFEETTMDHWLHITFLAEILPSGYVRELQLLGFERWIEDERNLDA